MLAVCKISEGVGGIAVEEREPRDPEAKEILVKVAAAGICGTDMQIYHWAPRMARRMAFMKREKSKRDFFFRDLSVTSYDQRSI